MKRGILALADPVKGMLAAAIAFGSYSTSDVLMKKMTVVYPTVTLAVYSIAFGILMLMLYALATRQMSAITRPKVLKPHILRSITMTITYTCFLTAIAGLPLANVYTLAFTMPLIVTLLGFLILKEKPQGKTILALLIGFSGVIIALRPGDWHISVPMMAALGIGIFLSGSNLIVRMLPKDEHWLATSVIPLSFEFVYFALFGLAMGMIHILSPIHTLMMAGVGVLMALGMCMTALAFRLAPMSKAACFHYTQLVWGVAYGWLFFGDVLDIWTATGAVLIIGSGMWLLLPHKGQKTLAQPLPETLNSNK